MDSFATQGKRRRARVASEPSACLARKLVDAVVLLAMVLVFNFFLFRIVDRDPLAKYRGRSKLSQEQREAIIERFGLDGSKVGAVHPVRQPDAPR